MKWLLKFVNWRAAQQHTSVAALAIGLVASLAGIPLPPEEINALVTAGSIVLYVWSQLRPRKPAPETVPPP